MNDAAGVGRCCIFLGFVDIAFERMHIDLEISSCLYILSDLTWKDEHRTVVQVRNCHWQGTSLLWEWSVQCAFAIQSGPLF